MKVLLTINLLFLVFSDGFLLDSASQSSNGNTPDKINMNILNMVDFIVEEKRLRHKIESFVNQLKQDQNQLKQQFSTRVSALERQTTDLETSTNLMHSTNQDQSSTLQGLGSRYNTTHKKEQTMQNQLKKVYVSSCVSSSGTISSSGRIPFPDKRQSAGISRLSSFLSSGIFTADEKGVYLVFATIYSYTRGAYFYIYKNNSVMTQTFVGTWYTDNYFTTATGSVVMELNSGETISVRAGTSMTVYAPYSCISITKIK